MKHWLPIIFGILASIPWWVRVLLSPRLQASMDNYLNPTGLKYLAMICIGISFIWANFMAWSDEHNNVTKLQQEIDDSERSSISATIDFAILGANPQGSHAAIVVSLTNRGAASAIDPKSWKLTALTIDKNNYNGEPNTILNKNLDFCLSPHKAYRFVHNDALYLKAQNPITRNGAMQGLLWFSFPDLSKDVLLAPQTKLLLECQGVSGQKINASITIKELIEMSKHTRFMPGIENPRPLDIPCKQNAPY